MKNLNNKLKNFNIKKSVISLIMLCIIIALSAGVMYYAEFKDKISTAKQEYVSDNSSTAGEEKNKSEENSENGYKLHKEDNEKEEHHEEDLEFFDEIEHYISLSTIDYVLISLLIGLITIALIYYWLIIDVWIMKKAIKDERNVKKWGIIILFTNIIGCVIYFIVRLVEVRCPKCNKIQRINSKYCSHCGTFLNTFCSECGGRIYKDDMYCKKCGKKVIKDIK